MTKAGFTGTRGGMTVPQEQAFTSLLDELRVREFHHGDCVGSDAQAHTIAAGNENIHVIVIHPPKNSSQRAFMGGEWPHVKRLPPLPYLERNHNIVDATDFLIATPRTSVEAVRSGTWATIRYAHRKALKTVYLIHPNGFVRVLKS